MRSTDWLEGLQGRITVMNEIVIGLDETSVVVQNRLPGEGATQGCEGLWYVVPEVKLGFVVRRSSFHFDCVGP